MSNLPTSMKDGVLLVTGGTGSFGNAVVSRFIAEPLKEIRILSRDERKQDEMRRFYKSDKLKFYIGDVRDSSSLGQAMFGCDFLFHAAALKQVPSCEFFPTEAVKTNVLGTQNVLDLAVQEGVRRAVVLSTDKAVYPINAMGLSKGLMEKVAIARARDSKGTIINVTRYGNVMASRGSVIPLFAKQIASGQPLTITDPKMTRFMMTLESAVDLVLFAFEHGESGDLFVQKAPAATISTLAEALARYLSVEDVEINVIGTRHGEKLFESLLTREERRKSIDLGDYFKVQPDLRDLNYDSFIERGAITEEAKEEYTSHNTHRLDVDEMLELLRRVNLEDMQAVF